MAAVRGSRTGECTARSAGVEECGGLITLFEQVAAEQGWQPGAELRAYAERAIHIVGLVDSTIAGGLQLALPDEQGLLPYTAVWPEVTVEGIMAGGEVTVLALAPAFRGYPGLFWQVCVEMWRYCVAHGIEAVLLEATPPMLRLYRRIGFPLAVVGELREHWGEECYLCRLGIAEVASTVLIKSLRSKAYRQMVILACRPLCPAGCTPR